MTVPARAPAAQLRYIAAILALAAIWLAMLIWGGGALDHAIYEALYAGGRPALVTVARLFTALGEPTVLIAAAAGGAFLLWRAGHRHLPWILIAASANCRNTGSRGPVPTSSRTS
jgi:hypothetical protein